MHGTERRTVQYCSHNEWANLWTHVVLPADDMDTELGAHSLTVVDHMPSPTVDSGLVVISA